MIKNFAHRGFSREYPENTLLAFEKAIEIGIDGIEFDVQLTKDNQVVIIHDETIDRTSDGSGFVCEHTYEELLNYDFSKEFNSKFPKTKIPLLSEYFELVKGTEIISNIELKNSILEYKGIEKVVYDLIKEYNLEDRVIISSFNHESMMTMKAIDKSIKCGLLVDCLLIEPQKYVKTYEMDAYHPMGYGVKKETVEKLKDEGIEVNVWLGKEAIDYKVLIDMNVDAIISDDPDKVKKLLNI